MTGNIDKSKRLHKKKCLYCRKMFVPARLNDAERAAFCDPDHRSWYHKYGTKEYRRLLDLMVKELMRQAEDAALMQLEKSDRKAVEKLRKRGEKLQRESETTEVAKSSVQPEGSWRLNR